MNNTINTTETQPVSLDAIRAGIKGYAAKMKDAVSTEFAKNFSNCAIPEIEVKLGNRYAKVFRVEKSGSRHVLAFIDMNTGDVLKPATWSAPAKHARGNVLSPQSGFEHSTWLGPQYLR